MTARKPTVEPLDSDDLSRAERLLDENDLPYRDVRTEPDRLVGILSDGDLLGVGALERYDTVGLLRSIAVEESHRGSGLGSLLCNDLEAWARKREVDLLYLLTTSATEFFRARGYVEVRRSDAPPSIQDTTEFRDLCPKSAVCMRKRIR